MERHKAVNPSVQFSCGTEIDDIHARRMLDAFAKVFLELLVLNDDDVTSILNKWSITLLPGMRVGIDYPEGMPQVLSEELKTAKEKKAEVQEMPPVYDVMPLVMKRRKSKNA